MVKYLVKIISVIITLLIIKLAYRQLSPGSFQILSLTLALSVPIAVIVGFASDWCAQRLAAGGTVSSYHSFLKHTVVGLPPAVLISLVISNGDLILSLAIVLLSVLRSLNSYIFSINLQLHKDSNRAYIGMSMFEPTLWITLTSLMYFGAEYMSLVVPENMVSIVAIALVIFIPYFPLIYITLPSREDTGHRVFLLFSKEYLFVVLAKISNTLVTNSPTMLLSSFGFQADAASFSIAQRYANLILVFEQTRSRYFSAQFLRHIGEFKQLITELTVKHRVSAFATWCLMISTVSLFMVCQYYFEIDTEIQYSFFFIALASNTLTVFEFGFGAILMLNNYYKQYLLLNVVNLMFLIISFYIYNDPYQSLMMLIFLKTIYSIIINRLYKHLCTN